MLRNLLCALGMVGALGMAVATPALATEAYECAFQQKASNGNWVPEVLVIAWEGKPDQAFAYDPLIDHFVGEPVPAKLITDNNRRSTWSWEVRTSSRTNQSSRMLFRVTVMKADLSATITATPQGYEGNYQSSGRCKKLKG